MTPSIDSIQFPAAADIIANGIAKGDLSNPHTMLAIAKEVSLAANHGALQRFLAQWELLTGGPEEYGHEAYNRVIEVAADNIFEALGLEEVDELNIEIGSYVIKAVDDKDGEKHDVFWNHSYGWVDSKEYASGYASREKAEDAMRTTIDSYPEEHVTHYNAA